jgi:DNA-binding IclR family transcriptional regulator
MRSKASRTPKIRPVPAVSRAIAILHLLSRSNKPMGVNAISRELKIVPSTCLHILRALVQETFLFVDPVTRQYSLDTGALVIARRFLQRNTFALRVQPILDQWAQKFNLAAVALRVNGLKQVVSIAVAHSDDPVQIRLEIGSHYPALASAQGLCLAAFGGYTRSEIERPFVSLRWHRAPTLKQWRALIENTRMSGYGVDEGYFSQGLTQIGVPVLGADGSISHVLGILGVCERATEIGITRLGREMRTKVAQLFEVHPEN